MNLIFNVMIAGIDVYLINYYFKLLKIEKKKYCDIVSVLSILLLGYVYSYYIPIDIIYLLVLICSVICISLSYQLNIKLLLKIITMILFMRIFVNYTFLNILEFIKDSPLVVKNSSFLKPINMFYFCATRYFEYLIVVYKLKLFDTGKTTSFRFFKYGAFIVSILYSLILLHNNFTLLKFRTIGFTLCFTLITYNVVLILFDRYYVKHEEIAKEYAVLKREEELREMYNARLEKEQNKLRHLRHDMKNQLIAVSSYIEDEEGKKHMASLLKDVEMTERVVHIGKYPIDVLIDTKINYAKSQGIEFVEKYGIISFGIIEITEIVQLIGSLLDNAIEGAMKVKEGKKEILFSLNNVGAYTIIRVVNSIPEGIEIKFEESDKEDDEEDKKHGFGYMNIEEIPKKYNGDTYRKVEKDFVEVSVMLLSNPHE